MMPVGTPYRIGVIFWIDREPVQRLTADVPDPDIAICRGDIHCNLCAGGRNTSVRIKPRRRGQWFLTSVAVDPNKTQWGSTSGRHIRERTVRRDIEMPTAIG